MKRSRGRDERNVARTYNVDPTTIGGLKWLLPVQNQSGGPRVTAAKVRHSYHHNRSRLAATSVVVPLFFFLSDRAAPFGLPSGVVPKPIFSVLFRLRLRSVRRSSPLRTRSFDTLNLSAPVLHFMRLKKADSASVLWTRVGEIVRHAFSSDWRLTRLRVGKFPASFESARRGRLRGKASCASKHLLRAGYEAHPEARPAPAAGLERCQG